MHRYRQVIVGKLCVKTDIYLSISLQWKGSCMYAVEVGLIIGASEKYYSSAELSG